MRQPHKLELVEVDLIRALPSARIKNALTDADVNYLLSDELRKNDFYVDVNFYQKKHHRANLKYATGKIFYYTSQKNCIVLKANSVFEISLENTKANERVLEMDLVYPSFIGKSEGATLQIYFNTKKLFDIAVQPEEKPRIKPFRYTNVLSSIWFYLRHPGRSVLLDDTGWKKIRVHLPTQKGILRIAFDASTNQSYLFLGTPRIFGKVNRPQKSHVNVVYLIFDCLAKNHLDIYEFYDLFQKHGSKKAMEMIPIRDRITPAIDAYFEKAIIFDKMYSVGQVTRPSIVSLWTSRVYTESRLPVFRNIVTKENHEEFHRMNFAALGDILSSLGYFTKQIGCNAQGHAVASVGVDLGFDENYDYTMETSEHPEITRRIVEFFQENQNRKFFLYAHINTPHSPSWVPLPYYLKALWDTDFIHSSAVALANIRYLNSHLERIFEAAEKLNLFENTIFIITADHSFERHHKFRSFVTTEEHMWAQRESTSVAHFHPRSIYTRKGNPNLFSGTMNVPFVVIIPKNTAMVPGKVSAIMSTLDVAPTLLDLTVGISEKKFLGKSFKNILYMPSLRQQVWSEFIPLVGRFQNGFIYQGKYLYWRDLVGLYRFTVKDGKKYIMHSERIFDIQNDPFEVRNLLHDESKATLIQRLRKLYFERFTDYPDKTFVKIVPEKNKMKKTYMIDVRTEGKIIYPRLYCNRASYTSVSENRVVFNIEVQEKNALVSFETVPPLAPISIYMMRDGKPVPKTEIYLSAEMLTGFGNPLQLRGIYDFHIARTPGKTGLEPVNLPENSVYVYRIPLNYWLEMNVQEKDIRLSPGIKEVLRGWGYIQ